MTVRVGLTYDLRDEYLQRGFSYEEVAEFDFTGTIEALETTLASLGYAPDRIGSVSSLVARLAAGDRWDVVFNIAEGLGGRCREAQVPCLLEAYAIPYTFSDPLVCALTLDKALAKRVVSTAGVRTASFVHVETEADIAGIDLEYPLFVKPNAEGTGKGINGRSVITDVSQLAPVCRELLANHSGTLLVEEFLPGREFTVGILGTGSEARAIGTMEIHIPGDAHAVYSFEVKENCERLVKYSRLEEGALKQEVEETALAAYRFLACRDAGRVDVRLDRQNRASFIEINPLPGLHPHHSDLPMIATQEGMPYSDLISRIICSTLARNVQCRPFPSREVTPESRTR